MEERHIDPYLQQLQYDLETSGRSLLNLSSDPIASQLALNEDLNKLGKMLHEMDRHDFTGGKTAWEAFLDKGNRVSEIIEGVLRRVRKNMPTSDSSKKDFADLVSRAVGNLRNEWEIGKEYRYTPELEKLRNSFRILGYNFHGLANLPESDIFGNTRQGLLELGRRLRALSTPEFFGYDGAGVDPIQKIKDEVKSCIKIGEETLRKWKK